MESMIEQGHDGLYSLCVNTSSIESEDEVRKIFSAYGSVERVHHVKENLVFVRYNNREDAVDCFRDMRNNPRFNVKAAIKRTNNDLNSPQIMTRGGERRRYDGENRGGGYHRGDGDSNNGDLSPLPPLVAAGIARSKEVDTSKCITAKEVIIGNLPPKIKQVDVFNLCNTTKVKPLHIAMRKVKKPPYRIIHYACVFVKTDEDVAEIVDGLDSLNYRGHRMFVNLASKFCELGKTSLQS